MAAAESSGMAAHMGTPAAESAHVGCGTTTEAPTAESAHMGCGTATEATDMSRREAAPVSAEVRAGRREPSSRMGSEVVCGVRHDGPSASHSRRREGIATHMRREVIRGVRHARGAASDARRREGIATHMGCRHAAKITRATSPLEVIHTRLREVVEAARCAVKAASLETIQSASLVGIQAIPLVGEARVESTGPLEVVEATGMSGIRADPQVGEIGIRSAGLPQAISSQISGMSVDRPEMRRVALDWARVPP